MLIGSKNIVVGKEIEPGYYDIIALEGHSEFFGRKMRENTTLHAVPLWENNRFFVAGKVELVPPVFGSAIQDENSLIIKNSGYYVVGEEILEGDYILMKPEDDTCKVFVDIKNEKQNESTYTIQWDREISQPQGNAHIHLKNGYQIFVMVEDQNHYVAEHAKLALEKRNDITFENVFRLDLKTLFRQAE